jgi:hypothetical protein
MDGIRLVARSYLVAALTPLIALLCLTPAVAYAQFGPAPWLDVPGGRPAPWNVAGAAVPSADFAHGLAPLQCAVRERPADIPEEQAIARAGWRLETFWPTAHRGDVAVIQATADYDGMCRPSGYNAFVFSAGRFAGTVSPELMYSRSDGALLEVPEFLPSGQLSATYVRYDPRDPLCCPSRPRTRVIFRLDIAPAGPVLVPERAAPAIAALPQSGDGSRAGFFPLADEPLDG